MTDDFTQSGEGAMIAEWAARRDGPGRWLSLGEADGLAASNVRALALRGWAGVAVEPAAVLFDRLASLYADRLDVECVQAAVVFDDHGGLTRFWYSHDLVSTTEQANAETWGEVAEFVPVYVATVTVAELLDTFPGPYDMVSIDVEGTSVELWHALRRHNAFAPGALAVIEAENGTERWQIQEPCTEGWYREGVTPNNVLLSRMD